MTYLAHLAELVSYGADSDIIFISFPFELKFCQLPRLYTGDVRDVSDMSFFNFF